MLLHFPADHHSLVINFFKGGLDPTCLRTSASFEIDTFPWSQSRVHLSIFYSFTSKVGFKCTSDIL